MAAFLIALGPLQAQEEGQVPPKAQESEATLPTYIEVLEDATRNRGLENNCLSEAVVWPSADHTFRAHALDDEHKGPTLTLFMDERRMIAALEEPLDDYEFTGDPKPGWQLFCWGGKYIVGAEFKGAALAEEDEIVTRTFPAGTKLTMVEIDGRLVFVEVLNFDPPEVKEDPTEPPTESSGT